MSSRVTGGALRSAYTAGGRVSSGTSVGGRGTTGGFRQGITPSAMQSDPRAYGMYLQDMYRQKISEEEAQREQELSQLERQIRQYENMFNAGRKLSTTEKMRYNRLLELYQAKLNPGRGVTGIAG